jgi:hypothetical protein
MGPVDDAGARARKEDAAVQTIFCIQIDLYKDISSTSRISWSRFLGDCSMRAIAKSGADGRAMARSVQVTSRDRPLMQGIGDECRRARRRSSDMPAYLTASEMTDPVRCKVRDISATGARLRLTIDPRGMGCHNLPQFLTLVMPGYQEETRVDCRIAHMRGADVGVAFHGQFKTVQKVRRRPA